MKKIRIFIFVCILAYVAGITVLYAWVDDDAPCVVVSSFDGKRLYVKNYLWRTDTDLLTAEYEKTTHPFEFAIKMYENFAVVEVELDGQVATFVLREKGE